MTGLVLLAAMASSPESVAFHYGQQPPVELLRHHDWAVIDPGAQADPAELRPAVPIAYVALGEVHPGAPWAPDIDPTWVLGSNPDWGGRILDLAADGWSAYLLEKVLPELWARGFRGFFFDALDSHRMVKTEPEEDRIRWDGLNRLIAAIRRRFPDAVIVLNRGFEILEQVAPIVDGVAAESLFAGFVPAERRYRPVPEADRAWLLERLDRARELGLVTVAIDYLPPADRAGARRVARRIAELGHRPWVAPGELDGLGVGVRESLPRLVWLLHDSEAEPDLAFSAVHRFLAKPLEYLGLVPIYLDVRKPLPDRRIAGEVAGVVAWLGGAPLARPAPLRRFLLKQVEDGIPLVLFGALGEEADDRLLERLGLARSRVSPGEELEAVATHAIARFEAAPPRPLLGVSAVRPVGEGIVPLIEVGPATPVLLAPWGGLALQPYAVADGASGEGRWVIDPFAFFERALRLEPAPMLDPTTENGRRLLIAHVDGDGAPSRAELPGRPLAIAAFRTEVLERYRIPHLVSVVEGEIAPHGLFPDLSAELEAEARRIFRLPHVEPASHGFSHPFDWGRFEAGEPAHLGVPGGTPSLEREIRGSLEYVAALAGRPARAFLWTGDALPGARSLALAREAGVVAMNGGLTVATKSRASVTHVSPMARPVKGAFASASEAPPARGELHVYAPMMNENVYTDGWRGPFWGYRRAIETFDFTERSRRLAPLGIYVHFYSATKKASLAALHDVYRDALSRSPIAVPASTWPDRVRGFRRATLSVDLAGRYRVLDAEPVRTLRVPAELGDIDLDASEGVLGSRDTEVGRFLHLDGRARASLAFGRARGPRLVEASAEIRTATRTQGRLDLVFSGSGPVELTVAGVRRCAPRPIGRTPEGLKLRTRGGERVSCEGRR